MKSFLAIRVLNSTVPKETGYALSLSMVGWKDIGLGTGILATLNISEPHFFFYL